MNHRLSVSVILFFFIIMVSLEGYGKNTSGDNSSESGEKTRTASFAGSFYPGDSKGLKKAVDTLLKDAQRNEKTGTVIAATAPHAGYIYSGGVAAQTFKNISNNNFDTIVIIGHDSYRGAVAYTCPVDYFETPLGKVPVDKEMIYRMQRYSSEIKPDIAIHRDDHTIEVQLPFLQAMGKKCKIVPLIFGYPSPENCRTLADAITSASEGKRIFVLASTDMSHYPTYEGANKMDRITLEKIKSMDIKSFFKHVFRQSRNPELPGLKTAICASGGVGTAMLLAKDAGADKALVLKYANSGDVPGGDKNRVVGYSSVLFVKD